METQQREINNTNEMTREEAIRRIKAWNLDSDDMEVLATIIPEFKESEDEKIIRLLRELGSLDTAEELYEEFNLSYTDVLYWLEKQKKNPKSVNSIPSDCTVGTKCEDRWHKVVDSLPDNPRQVLCKDAIGNFFIGRYYKSSKSWEVVMYDDWDKSNEDNPPVVKWCEIPSEKQEEQKPAEWNKATINGKPIPTENHSVDIPLAEWSEEDERKRNGLIKGLEDRMGFGWASDPFSREEYINWLKSLHPQPKLEWSEEDERMQKEVEKMIVLFT